MIMRGTLRRARTLDSESVALATGVVVFAVTAIIALVVFWGRDLPIDGRGSLGDFSGLAGALAAAAGFALARFVSRGAAPSTAKNATAVRFRWFDLAALTFAHAVIALLAWIGIATIMEHSFSGATVYSSPAALLAAAAAALSAYVAFLSGTNLSARQLSLVLAVFLVVGTMAAMLSSSDPLWWQMNLSALGITHDISSLAFNITIIISGILVTTIARLATAGLPVTDAADRRRRRIVRVLFVLLGLLLACVGIFPVDRFFLVHNTVATGMAVAYAALVIGLPWLVPTLPRIFIALGFVFVAVIILLAVLFAVGIYNLTAVELVAALLIFSWIILFLRNVDGAGPPSESAA